MGSDVVLQMNHIMKVYGNGIMANADVSLELVRGEIHALLGENGAGKSTLMKVLFGIETPNEGEIILNGQPVTMKSSQEAIRRGIGMVHQHFMLVPSLTVTENIILGTEPKKGIFIDRHRAEKEVKEIAGEYNFDMDVTERIENLSVGMKQKVEILKALWRGAKILILDEPTAVLTPQETDELFIQLEKLRKNGCTIIFISHKLDEIKRICSRATIMRSGRSMGTYEVSKISTTEMSRLMVGYEVKLSFEKKPKKLSEELFMKIRNLTVHNTQGIRKVDQLSFDLKGGEILGIAGVEGNGQNELVEVLTGLNRNYEGEIQIKNQDIKKLSIHDIRKLKVAHIPEDRMSVGCAATLSIDENLLSNQYRDKKYAGRFLLDSKKIERTGRNLIGEYLIKCGSGKQKVGMLSGGNIQKVIAAREFSVEPDIIIANQPTRGIDVGAASFIRKKILEFRDAGCAVILISADLTELLSLSDRLAIMYKGRITGVFDDTEQVTEAGLGEYMLGLKYDEEQEGLLYE